MIPPSVIKQAKKKQLIKESPAYQEAAYKAKWLARAEEVLAWFYVAVAASGVFYLGVLLKGLLLG